MSKTTPQAETASEPKATKTLSRLDSVLSQLRALTEDERELLARHGFSVPEGDLTGLRTGKHKWGIRCRRCNKVALYFLGDKWTMGGTEYDEPPAIHHTQIAWVQDLPSSEIDRHQPRCQHCRNIIPLQQSGAFEFGNRVGDGRSKLVLVEDFERSRDAAFSEKNRREFRRKVSKETAASSHTVSPDYNIPKTPISKTIDAQQGEGFTKQLNAAADALGIQLVPSQ